MNKFHALLVLVLCSFCCGFNLQGKGNETMLNGKVKAGKMDDVDVMTRCNQTFMIKSEYLQELNDTGSFPDEYEKIPMCFIKCYLESLGVISSDGKIVVEKAISAYQIDNEEDVDNCIKELTAGSITEECEKAYFFVRCLMTNVLLNNLGEDNDKIN